MSRLTQTSITHNYSADDLLPDIIYNKIVLDKPSEYDENEKVLAIDADSILYTASYFPEKSLLQFPTDELQLEEAKFRIRNKLQEITNNVEEWFNIKQTLIFLGGKSNFRYKIYPKYKSNRKDKEKSPLIPLLKRYMIEEIPNVMLANGSEADDYVYEINKISGGNCVIASIDKDVLYWNPNTPIYDYRTYDSKILPYTSIIGTFKRITEKKSRLSIVTQIICGDMTDFVPGAKGIADAWCKKNVHEDMTDYQFIKQIFLAYLKSTKGDVIEAKKQIKLFYKILKLWTKDELKSLNL